jgi:SRSO17 transposase
MQMMKRFDAYLSRAVRSAGHADRDKPMREYCKGLMLPLKRKSGEPIAAHVGLNRRGNAKVIRMQRRQRIHGPLQAH